MGRRVGCGLGGVEVRGLGFQSPAAHCPLQPQPLTPSPPRTHLAPRSPPPACQWSASRSPPRSHVIGQRCAAQAPPSHHSGPGASPTGGRGGRQGWRWEQRVGRWTRRMGAAAAATAAPLVLAPATAAPLVLLTAAAATTAAPLVLTPAGPSCPHPRGPPQLPSPQPHLPLQLTPPPLLLPPNHATLDPEPSSPMHARTSSKPLNTSMVCKSPRGTGVPGL